MKMRKHFILPVVAFVLVTRLLVQARTERAVEAKLKRAACLGC
jgi:hypothetical protein